MTRDFSPAGAAVEDNLGILRVKVAIRNNDSLQWGVFLHFLGERRRDSLFLVLHSPTLADKRKKEKKSYKPCRQRVIDFIP